MKVRMIFATIVNGELHPAESTPDLPEDVAAPLIFTGRVEALASAQTEAPKAPKKKG